jgi:hypothetical protein
VPDGEPVKSGASARGGEAARDYARRLYDRTIAWEDAADRKAQLILGFDGVFLSFLVSAVLTKPNDLRPITARFGPDTWLLAAGMALALVASITCALRCLVSWLLTDAQVKAQQSELGVAPADPATHDPQVLWYFQHVRSLDEQAFRTSVGAVDPAIETLALGAATTHSTPRRVSSRASP